MKKIYRKPVTKVIVIEDSLLYDASQSEGQDQTIPTGVTLNLIWDREEEGYAD